MARLAFFFVLTVSQLISTAARAGSTRFDYRVVGQEVYQTMIVCPARIWPNYDWKNIQLALVSARPPSFLWSPKDGSLKILPESALPESARISNYLLGENLEIFNHSQMPGDFTESIDQAFQTIVHEGFHRFAQHQRNWHEVLVPNQTRATDYPLDAKPRMYRRMLFDRLSEYFLGGGKNRSALGQAAYWYDIWKKEFPQEQMNSMDLTEGTAYYVELLAAALTHSGCRANDTQLFLDLKKVIAKNTPGFSVNGKVFGLDSEGYEIGAVAGFILKFINKNNSWYTSAELGISPVEFLLRPERPMMDTVPTAIEKQFRVRETQLNREIGGWFDPVLQNLESDAGVRIVIPVGTSAGTYSPEGFYWSKLQPGLVATPLALPSDFSGSDWQLHANVGAVLLDLSSTACKSPLKTIVAPASSVRVQGDLIEFTDASITGRMRGETVVDSSGQTWFCGRP